MAKKELPPGMTKRGNTYWADCRVKGARIRKSLSRNLKVAKELLTELRARAQRGDFGLLDNDYPIEDLKRQYLRHCDQTLRADSVLRYRASLDTIIPTLPRRVSQLSIDAILTHRENRLAEGVGALSVNYEVSRLQGMLNWAVQPARLIADNPLKGIKPLPKESNSEGRALTTEEVARLLAEAKQPWRDIFYAFLATGMRRKELAALLFDDIDWDAREVVVQRNVAKSHRPRRIPIDDELWDILKRQEAGRDSRQPTTWDGTRGEQLRPRFTRDHVFVTTQSTPLTCSNSVYEMFLRCCRNAGIEIQQVRPDGMVERVDLHSLRRTFATHLIVSGADPKTVQELLGHKTLEMTMNLYARIHTGTKRQAIGRLPWGRGATTPDHLVEYQRPDGHVLPTVSARVAVSG